MFGGPFMKWREIVGPYHILQDWGGTGDIIRPFGIAPIDDISSRAEMETFAA